MPTQPTLLCKARHCYIPWSSSLASLLQTTVDLNGQLPPHPTHAGPGLVICHSRWCPVDPRYDLPPTAVAITGALGPSVIGDTSVDTFCLRCCTPWVSELMTPPGRWPSGHFHSHSNRAASFTGQPPHSMSDAYKRAPVHERRMHAPSIPLFLPPGAHTTSPCQVCSPWVSFFPRWGSNSGLNPHFLQETFPDCCRQLICVPPCPPCVPAVCTPCLPSPHRGPAMLKSDRSSFCLLRTKPQPRAVTLHFRNEYPELPP